MRVETNRISLSERVADFAFRPASPIPLAGLRILVSAILLLQAFLISPDLFDLYGRNGILQGALGDYFASDTLPGVSSFLRWTSSWGLAESFRLIGLGMAYVVSLLFLVFGYHTRIAAVVSWFTHLLLAGSHFSSYGVDQFAHVFLFYFIWMPVGHAISLDSLLGRVDGKPSEAARISIRIVQAQLCIVYFASGVGKAMGEQWWNGEAIWRSLMLPIYNQYNFSWVSQYPWLAKIGAWSTLLIEIGYPIFIWPRRTRLVWVVAIVGLHVGIGAFLGLGTFAGVMASLTFCAFGLSSDPYETTIVPIKSGETLALSPPLLMMNKISK